MDRLRPAAKTGLIMNLPIVIEQLRSVLGRQHKAIATEDSPETQALLQTVRDRAGYPTNLIARLLYGCGLRVAEPLNLRCPAVFSCLAHPS